MKSDWIWWVGGAVVAYYFYRQYQSGLLTTGTVAGYVPIANVSGDQFSCPVGTKFTEIESQVSGSGYCS
jgi:hypothetical protein